MAKSGRIRRAANSNAAWGSAALTILRLRLRPKFVTNNIIEAREDLLRQSLIHQWVVMTRLPANPRRICEACLLCSPSILRFCSCSKLVSERFFSVCTSHGHQSRLALQTWQAGRAILAEIERRSRIGLFVFESKEKEAEVGCSFAFKSGS